MQGCKDRNSIQIYRVSKEDPSSATSATQQAPMGLPPIMQDGTPGLSSNCPIIGPGSKASTITDTPPSTWGKKPASAMRQASYLAKGKDGAQADISLIILAGTAGGELDNVNRWLSQLGQQAITQEQLDKMTQVITAPLGKVTVVDLQGKPEGGDTSKDGRIIAGMVAGEGGGTWFFKMRGNPEITGAEKDHFLKWITTVKRAAGNNLGTATSPFAPAMDGNAVPTSAGDAEKPKVAWTLPADWKPAQGSQMRYASFSASGENGSVADISVSFFPGSVGGDLGNVNRWRNQIGLAPVAETDLPSLIIPVPVKDGTIKTMELAGTNTKMLAAWIPVNGNTWFFKLTAPSALADRQKDSFMHFLKSVRFQP